MSHSEIHEQLHEIETEYNSLLYKSTLEPQRVSCLRDQYRIKLEQLSFFDRATYFFGNQVDQLIPTKNILTCIAVIKDEPNINLLLSRLTALDFDQIILIQDYSTQEFMPDPGSPEVFYKLEVRAGAFGLCKSLWIESICNYFFDQCWVATIDADEFIDIDSIYQHAPSINSLAKSGQGLKAFLRECDHDYVPFCLLDVLPRDLSLPDVELLNSSFYYCVAPDASKFGDYGNQPAVKWSFGGKYDSQYLTDLRYHFYQIAESRAKVSLVLWDKHKELMLHQGFHNVTDRSTGVVHDIAWARRLRVPCKTIVHQKILFTRLNPPTSGKLSQYFPRTAQNISTLTKELSNRSSSQALNSESLFVFRGTLFMPSWAQNGKLLYTDKTLLDPGACALSQDYEFILISGPIFDSILRNLHCFVAQKVVRINRRLRYIQLRNISV